jgi:predicted O-methyltransferase YrrM
MNPTQWAAVDDYIGAHFTAHDSALDAALAHADAAGLPPIQVAPNQGKLLHVLARSINARHILELGTLGGYSTIWLARALPPDGALVTCELDPKHAHIARENVDRAGVGGLVDIRIGRALDTLDALAGEARPPFDFVFIDADKVNTPAYFERVLTMTRVGAMIIVDNVIRKGDVIDADSDDASVQGMRRFFEQAGQNPCVVITAVQTVGSKGYDGLAVALVVS